MAATSVSPPGDLLFDAIAPAAKLLRVASATDTTPTVNLLVPTVAPGELYAGIDTALTVAASLAREVGRPCRVVLTEQDDVAPTIARALGERYGADVEVLPTAAIPHAAFSSLDVWIATHFRTAVAVGAAVGAGLAQTSRVVYLVQDYEPGFVPWSTEHAIARAGYHAGFRMLVNSAPVAEHLGRVEGIDVPAELVFAPNLPLERLRHIAAARPERPRRTIAFYGRPGRDRNLFELGVAALAVAAQRLGDGFRYVSMGAGHAPVALRSGVRLEPLGKLTWDGYFDALAKTDVLVSLQYSPHPSHPPLEAAESGAIAVTNEFGGTRAGLHPRLLAVEPTVDAIADGIVRAVGLDAPAGPVPGRALGVPLADAIATLAAGLRRANP